MEGEEFFIPLSFPDTEVAFNTTTQNVDLNLSANKLLQHNLLLHYTVQLHWF